MVLRVFSIRRDGSYIEVPAKKESFLDGNGAYLIMDRNEKKIYIYRKDGISSVLSYSAGRAATNLKTMKGSRYNIINIETEERDRIFPKILRQMETETYEDIPFTKKDYLPRQAYVYGEKTLAAVGTTEHIASTLKETEHIASTLKETEHIASTLKETEDLKQQQLEIKQTETELKTDSYDVDDIVRTLASKILFENDIKSLRDADKPPRYKLKNDLIKKIDDLLDKMYE